MIIRSLEAVVWGSGGGGGGGMFRSEGGSKAAQLFRILFVICECLFSWFGRLFVQRNGTSLLKVE